jgi:hypothetical protein
MCTSLGPFCLIIRRKRGPRTSKVHSNMARRPIGELLPLLVIMNFITMLILFFFVDLYKYSLRPRNYFSHWAYLAREKKNLHFIRPLGIVQSSDGHVTGRCRTRHTVYLNSRLMTVINNRPQDMIIRWVERSRDRVNRCTN